MDESSQTSGEQSRSGGFPWGLVIALGGLVLLVLAGAGFFVSKQTTPGTRWVYEVDGDSASAEQVVPPLQRRLRSVNARVKVTALDSRQIEVVVASRNPATLRIAKQLIESAGVLRFLILANSADHAAEIEGATIQASSGLPGSKSRDVRDQDGEIIGRWVTVGRESNSVGNIKPLRVNVSNALVRNADTGQLITLPASVRGADAEAAIAGWIDQQGITSLEVLMVVDPLLEVGGTDLAFAASSFDQNGNPSVAFNLTDAGSQRFFVLTTNNSPVGTRQRQLGLVLDDKLLSAPNILQPIKKEGRITGNFTREEVDLIVEILKAGQLPVELSKGAISETPVEVPWLADWF